MGLVGLLLLALHRVGAVFEWAGQIIMRSDWVGHSVNWAWFDVGPFGSSGHGHYDRLHLSVRSGGQSLLTDSGRFAYVRHPPLPRVVSFDF